jgi:SAM-dependent methyltransferase
MNNPWLEIPLADYEEHMALPHVGQAQLLADAFARALDAHAPSSVALLGCAGGNGLERVVDRPIERVVCVDINPQYIAHARQRWSTRIAGLDLFIGDLQTDEPVFEPVDLAFAGLLFEYVDVAKVLCSVRTRLRPHGILVTILQLPSPTAEAITPSPYTSLRALSGSMHLVPPERLRHLAEQNGYRPLAEETLRSTGDKEFRMQAFRRWRVSSSS